MDVFKLAFETMIVGILTFIWLGIAMDLLFPDLINRIVSSVPQQNQTLLAVGVLSLAYFIGSAIVPISSQLLNDEHWPLPEDAIRCQVSRDQAARLGKITDADFPMRRAGLATRNVCECSYWDRFLEMDEGAEKRTFTWRQLWKGLHEDDNKEEMENKRQILTLFQLQESKVLNQGTDKTEPIRQLHERIVVLRGAVFSGSALFLICLFACIAPVEGQPSPWKRSLWGILLAAASLGFGLRNGLKDLKYPDIFDVPVMEGLLGVITLFGAYLVVRGVRARPYLNKRFLVAVGFLAALAYGGWVWSEVIYDQQVTSSYAVMESAVKP